MSKLILKDGRVILSGKDYTALKELKRQLQGNRCAECDKPNPTDLHHKRSRGLGGGFRTDTNASTVLLCHSCHLAKSKGWNGRPLRG